MWVLENPVSASVLTLLAVCAVTITILAVREQSFAGVGGQMLQGAKTKAPEMARNTLESLLTKVQQTAQHVDSSLHEKIAQLEAANREANERVRELQNLARQTGEIEAFARGQRRTKPATRFSSNEDSTPDPDFLVEDAPRKPAGSRTPTLGPTIGHGRIEDAGVSSRPIDLRSARVCEMVDAGTAPINIAEALDMTLGEVELILNLREYR